MARWSLVGVVTGGKYIGTVEAETEEEAIEKGFQLSEASVSLCHGCASECEDPEIEEIRAEPVPNA